MCLELHALFCLCSDSDYEDIEPDEPPHKVSTSEIRAGQQASPLSSDERKIFLANGTL